MHDSSDSRGRLSRFHLGSIASFLPALTVLLVLMAPGAAGASATLGFLESWSGTTVHNWAGGADTTNPGTGGVNGAGDGYLELTRTIKHHLGARSIEPEYVGNWRAANIDEVVFWLNDVDTDEALEIHFSVGRFDNLWQYNVGFLPPENAWGMFTVDLRSDTSFTRLIGSPTATFEGALDSAQLVHIRHDKAPFTMTPDSIIGDVGIDELLLTNFNVSVPGARGSSLRPVLLAPPYPNPARGAVTLELESFDSETVRIEIVDALGRFVRRVTVAGEPGRRTWVWDRRDDEGRLVLAGAYRARARSSSGGTSRALVLGK